MEMQHCRLARINLDSCQHYGSFEFQIRGALQGFIFSESPTMQMSKKRYKQKNSSVVDFAESCFAEIFNGDSSAPFKDVYQRYREFCTDEGFKRAFSKKDFRSSLESEGNRIENSTKHANQLRIIVY